MGIQCQNNAKFSFAVDPLRAVYCVCDSPDKKSATEFMKSIRTDGDMDCDMLGKPGKIQMTVVEEFEMARKAAAVPDGFDSSEYRTDDDLDAVLNPLLAAVAAKKLCGTVFKSITRTWCRRSGTEGVHRYS